MNKQQYKMITEWQDKIFTKATQLSCVFHLIEEVEELRRDIENGHNSHEEIADCFLLLFGVCNKAGMKYEDIVKAINEKMIINRTRKWGKVNEKGYVKHI
jgi:NTP pyrophosphatase (non-canonical NTP hydrolase)